MNTEAIHNTALRNTYKGEMNAAITAVNRDPENEASTNDLHSHLKNVIIDTVTKILGLSRKKSRNRWFDDECKLATKQKNAAYRVMLHSQRTRARAETYHELRQTEKRLHRRKKEPGRTARSVNSKSTGSNRARRASFTNRSAG